MIHAERRADEQSNCVWNSTDRSVGCEAFLPVFLTGAKYGWFGFVLPSSVLAIATVAGMVLFTWLTVLGVQRLRFKGLEKYEHLVVGAVFCLLGLLIIFFER